MKTSRAALFERAPILLLLPILLAFPACIQSRMSLEKAKNVTISMSGKAIVPPPRRIEDITQILDQDPLTQEEIERLTQKADAPPPKGAEGRELVEFYYERAMAAKKLGRSLQVLEDLRTGAKHVGERARKTDLLLHFFENLASQEVRLHDFRAAINTLEKARHIIPDWSGVNNMLAAFYISIGDLKNAQEARRRALNIMSDWSGGEGLVWRNYHTRAMRAHIKHARGIYDEALVEDWRKLVKASSSGIIHRGYPQINPSCRAFLAENLMELGHLSEAEVEARASLQDTIRLFGNRSLDTRWRVELLGRVLSRQGRHEEAKILLERFLSSMKASELPEEAPSVGWTRFALGEVDLELGAWADALEQFQRSESCFENTPVEYKRLFLKKNGYAVALLMTNHSRPALDLLQQSLSLSMDHFGPLHPHTAEVRGLMGVACFHLGQTEQAFEHFAGSVPLLLEKGDRDSRAVPLIFDSYIDLLDRMRGAPALQPAGLDPFEESFRVAASFRSLSVHHALNQSLTRSALEDPETADLARREQDAEKQVAGLEALLSEHLLLPPERQEPAVLSDLRGRIRDLEEARKVIRATIEKTFPAYQAQINPPPPQAAKVRESLLEEEALVLIHPTATKTFVWAVSREGKGLFASSDLGREDLKKAVPTLRKALDPRPQTLADIPAYDVRLAHALFRELLKPVEAGWKEARDLLIAAPGCLGQIPFAVLPTAPSVLFRDTDLAFAEYRSVPWLIRKVSITRLPSVSSLISLRTPRKDNPSRKAFAGFGDPLFQPEPQGETRQGKPDEPTRLASRGVPIRVRGVRVTGAGSLDKGKLLSCQLSRLHRLPDTSEEIRSIARALGSNPEKDAFMGREASESRIKRMVLSDRKVVAFATHALVPGDLDGLIQPAIALSSPAVTGEEGEDGLLKMGEIMRLNLDADWVVLSACNTAAADGKGVEAVSGLGRAFFYAGSRALLASMWPVETSSARKLTTGLFRFQHEDPTLSRARALRKSMLNLLDEQVLEDGATGEAVASYAHPLFWAPFMVMGDGR